MLLTYKQPFCGGRPDSGEHSKHQSAGRARLHSPHHPEAQQAERRRCEANSGVWRAACGTGI